MKHMVIIYLTLSLAAIFTWSQNTESTHPVKTQWTSEARKDNRPADVWRYYMRGVVDHFATPIPFDVILSEKQKANVRFVDDDIRNPYKTHTQPAIQLNKVETLTFEKPLPIDLKKYAGREIRLFYWIKGNNVGAKHNCWVAPTTLVTLRNTAGEVIATDRGDLHTQGTYPWHCYYQDVFLPNDTASIELTIFTKCKGYSRWSAFSWEPVTKQNTYTLDEQQDPHTGSLAANPIYDEMPYHLKNYAVKAHKYPWRFVLGRKIGLVGQPYDITTKEGFSKYFHEQASKDPMHMNHAILHFQNLYSTGKKTKLLPPLEEGWWNHFVATLLAAQDDKTGFYSDGRTLSLGVTFHIASCHFNRWRMPRADRPDRRGAGSVDGFPKARQVIETVLKAQSTWTDPNGIKRKAAWNLDAYTYTTTPDKSPSKCYLGATWDAVWLLRTAVRYVDDPELKKRVYNAVKDSWWYVLHNNIMPDGMYKRTDTDAGPTLQGYMDTLISDVGAIERKVMSDVPQPQGVQINKGNEQNVYEFTWTKPLPGQDALRVYITPREVPAEDIDERFLTGIIQKRGGKIYEMDPLPAVQKIRAAYLRRYGTSEKQGALYTFHSPNTWRGAQYRCWKLRMIPWPLPSSVNAEPLPIQIYRPGQVNIYVSAVNWYGEESKPLRIPVKKL